MPEQVGSSVSQLSSRQSDLVVLLSRASGLPKMGIVRYVALLCFAMLSMVVGGLEPPVSLRVFHHEPFFVAAVWPVSVLHLKPQ